MLQFPDDSVTTVEFNREPVDSDIVATMQTMSPGHAEKIAETKVLEYQLQAPYFTRVKVANAMAAMSSMGKYHITDNNCQSTLKAFLRYLGVRLPKGVKELKKMLSPDRAQSLVTAFEKSVAR
ncbi:uncharacterized protein LOC119374988 [Rhipicephalus sanguineus]|uniref:uncharacterized protein LOC119374988 n=1 Tax=Rhipicephalus sanguineus TaxID=34632 RepID=UPI00189559E9|nr:uncharacterized protein LOC119374988 [Rhipicephalus sanguineus]